MHQTTRARAVQVAEAHRTVRWSWFQTVRTSAAGLHRRVRASLTPPTGAVSGAEAHRTGGMRRRRATRSTTCARRASRTRGTNRRLGNRRAVLRTPVTVTVRVTVSRGAERGYRRSAATTRTKPDGRGKWRRNGRVGGCRKMTNTARLGVVLIGVEAQGEGEGDAGQEGGGEATARAEPRVAKTDERDELLTTLAPVRSARAGCGCGIPWHRGGSAPGPEGGAGVRGGTHLRN